MPFKVCGNTKIGKMLTVRCIKMYFSLLSSSVGWSIMCTPKGCEFDSWSRHIPRLQVQSLIRARMGGNQCFSSMLISCSLCWSLCLSPPLSFRSINTSSGVHLSSRCGSVWALYGIRLLKESQKFFPSSFASKSILPKITLLWKAHTIVWLKTDF